MLKKILIIAFMAGALIGSANAADKVQVLDFAWDHDNPALVNIFEMHWGVAAGGPYAKLVDIPKSGTGPAFESLIEAIVTGSPGTHETRYFVLNACGDVPQEDGTTQYQCSDWSNEISYAFWIEAEGFSVPIQFRIISN